AIHFVTEQRLRMHGRGHVERLVVIICAFNSHEARGRVGANHLQEVGEAHTTEAANHVPSLNANMPCILREPGQGLNLRQRVISRLLHLARYRERPLVEINFGVIDVVVVDGKLVEWSEGEIGKRGRQMAGAEEPCRDPVAEAKAGLEQWFLQSWDGKGSQRYHRCEFQQLTPTDGFEFAAIGS